MINVLKYFANTRNKSPFHAILISNDYGIPLVFECFSTEKNYLFEETSEILLSGYFTSLLNYFRQKTNVLIEEIQLSKMTIKFVRNGSKRIHLVALCRKDSQISNKKLNKFLDNFSKINEDEIKFINRNNLKKNFPEFRAQVIQEFRFSYK